VAGTAFLALTVLATLGSGQHYLFDLFCAVPYAGAIAFLGSRIRMRRPVLTAAQGEE
jgi:hypothetical protein